MKADAVEHIEGSTKLLVPPASLRSQVPPTFPVFFNPAASLNRDVSVAFAAAAGTKTFCDAMTGVGSRGVRVANETSVRRVSLVDFNRESMALARKAVKMNKVGRKCEFALCETSSYLHSRYGRGEKFDCVDIDPFGTPVRQVAAAIGAVSNGGILSMTATDAAVLCGVHPKVCLRRYGARPMNNGYGHETAIRILVGYAARLAASFDVAATPVFAHSTRHYLRVFLRLEVGASDADANLRNVGYLNDCPRCRRVSSSQEPPLACDACGNKKRYAGPMWVGPLVSEEMMKEAALFSTKKAMDRATRLLESTSGVDGFPPWSFNIEEACSVLGMATVAEDRVRERLRSMGRRSMRQPFETRGLKTDADWKEFVEAVKGSG